MTAVNSLLADALRDRYVIERELGRGGMATVYLASDRKHGRQVAVKVLRPELMNYVGSERFLREIAIAAQLQHPHILTLIDSGDAKDEQSGERFLYYVMPFVQGESLRERISRDGALAPEEATRLLREVVDAVACAHAHGVVHRDIKPDNVMLAMHHALVVDFGVAKAMSDASDETTLTATGMSLGTPAYMAPEQALGDPAIDHRADIYAVGVLAYEMLTGSPPFIGRPQAVVAAHVSALPKPLRDVNPSIPLALERVVLRCLAKTPEARYQTAGELLAAIDSLAFADSIATAPGATRLQTKARRGPAASQTGGHAQPKARRVSICSLAVLPLENLSGDPDEDYFADGMTDALITTLAHIAALRVISRTSVMRYKGARRPLPDIARELKVEAVVEGTVMRSGSRVRIAAQLIHAATDVHLWSKTYETDLRDVLVLQSDIARSIAQRIRMHVTPREKVRLEGTRRVDPEAYEALLKGRHHWYRRTPDSLKKALEYLQSAVAKDPTYALAYAGLADAYISLGWDLFGILPPQECYPKAKDAAKRALELDPGCAEAHSALGWAAAGYDWDWATAEAGFRHAIELKPQYGPVHIWYSHFLTAMGRIDESREESRRALACDPLGLVLNMHMGWHHLYMREYRPAVEQLLKTLELDPGFIVARMFLGEAYEQMGMLPEAIVEFEQAVTLSQRHPIYLAGLGHALAVSGRAEEALSTIDELKQLSNHRHVSARAVAEIYMGLGDKEQAFAWLDKAFVQRNGWLLHLKENPRYDSLRADPRYVGLVRRMNLE